MLLQFKAAKAAEAAKKDEKGKKSGRSPSAGKRSKSPGKKKGKKEADIPPSPKKDTKLKRRGDVEDTFKTIGKLHIIAELAERSPIIIQNSSNPSS